MNPSLLTRDVVVLAPEGLHLRPADRLVRLANRYESTVTIRRSDSGGEGLDCKSILSLLTLGAALGDHLQISADGPDADQALGEIASWFEAGFSEDT